MPTDILNLPKWDVTELEESHDEYFIKARYTVQPEVCLSCGVIHPKLHRYGTKQQPFRDLPIHGKIDNGYTDNEGKEIDPEIFFELAARFDYE